MNEQTSNKAKVLIISLAYFPFIGGAEVAVKEIIKRLGSPEGEFEFDLITCNLDGQQKNEEQFENVKIYRVGQGKLGKLFFPFLAYKKAVELHKKNNYGLVWSIMANRAGLAALKVKEKFPGIKYLLTLQEGDPVSHIYKRTWFWFWRYKKIYQKADYAQVLSKWLEERAIKFGYQGKIKVVPNGVDINKFKSNYIQASVKEELKSQLKINSSDKIIFTTSRLVKKNDVKSLIQAIKILMVDYKKQVVLLVAGEGELEKELKILTKKLNLENNIIFLGHISQNNLPLYYSLTDIFVRPSLTEGQGISFMEAMAMGTPVIATPVGGIPDFLKAGETGWFCEVKNPKSIAEKINYILNEKNKSEVDRVVAKARNMVEEKYTWEKVAGEMGKIFKELC